MTSREPEPIRYEPAPQPGGVTRRRVLRGIGVGGGLLLAGGAGFGLRSALDEPTPPPEIRWRNAFGAPFGNTETNQAARRLGLNAGTYFLPSPEDPGLRLVTDGISADPTNVMHTGDVPPVFVPGSGEHVGWISQLIRDVPEVGLRADGRVIAMPAVIPVTVNTIETGGKRKAVSPDGAIGPMQVVPSEHLDKLVAAAGTVGRDIGITPENLRRWQGLIDQSATDPAKKTEATAYLNSLGQQEKITDALQDQFVGFQTGMRVLTEYWELALKKARETNPGINPNHLDVWKMTLAAYNGGPGRINESFEQWPDETQRYVLNALGLLMTAEVAHQAQLPRDNQPGLGPVSTARGARATDVDARVYAFSKTRNNWPTPDILRVLSTRDLAVPTDPQGTSLIHPGLVAEVQRHHDDYLTAWYNGGNDLFSRGLPLSAGVRRWVGPGDGETLLLSVDDNKRPNKYAANW